MASQDYSGPVQWIIVDDGTVPQEVSFSAPGWEVTVIRPEPFWEQGQNTQARNLAAGAEYVSPKDYLVIIEDDDWYSSTYLSDTVKLLDSYDLVGESHARYYNLPLRRYKVLGNQKHSSLCSTGMRGCATVLFKQLLQPGIQFIDLDLWTRFEGSKYIAQRDQVVGIKGLPGRGGIGMGHSESFSGKDDPSLEVFNTWVTSELYSEVL